MILWQILYKILHLLITSVQLSLKSWECCRSECYLFFPLSSLCAFDFTKLGSLRFHGWWKPWLHQSAEFPQLWHLLWPVPPLQASTIWCLLRNFSAHDSWIYGKNQEEKRIGYMLIWQMCNKKVWKEFLEESFLNTLALSPCFSICGTP